MRHALAFGALLVTAVFVACGGSSATPSPTPSPTRVPVPSASPSPTATAAPTAAPTATFTVAPTDTQPPATPPPTEAPTAVPTPVSLSLIAEDYDFSYNGTLNPTITVPAGTTTVTIQNTGASVHNLQVADAAGNFADVFCQPNDGTAFACSNPGTIHAGTAATLTVTFPAPGTYNFRCDFHPGQMMGSFVVQ